MSTRVPLRCYAAGERPSYSHTGNVEAAGGGGGVRVGVGLLAAGVALLTVQVAGRGAEPAPSVVKVEKNGAATTGVAGGAGTSHPPRRGGARR